MTKMINHPNRSKAPKAAGNPIKTTEWQITLNGMGGELDSRTVSVPDGTDDEAAESMVREAVADLVAGSIFADGDTIRIYTYLA